MYSSSNLTQRKHCKTVQGALDYNPDSVPMRASFWKLSYGQYLVSSSCSAARGLRMFLISNSQRGLGTIKCQSKFGYNAINILGAISLKLFGSEGF